MANFSEVDRVTLNISSNYIETLNLRHQPQSQLLNCVFGLHEEIRELLKKICITASQCSLKLLNHEGNLFHDTPENLSYNRTYSCKRTRPCVLSWGQS